MLEIHRSLQVTVDPCPKIRDYVQRKNRSMVETHRLSKSKQKLTKCLSVEEEMSKKRMEEKIYSAHAKAGGSWGDRSRTVGGKNRRLSEKKLLQIFFLLPTLQFLSLARPL